MYIKQLSERESVAYDCMEELALSEIIIPYQRDGRLLRAESSDKVFREDIDIPHLYEECLKYMYAIKTSRFSPGIYSFYGDASVPEDGEPYGNYLIRQVRSYVEPVMSRHDPILEQFGDMFYSGAHRFEKDLNSIHDYSLLHGDLYSQNIMRYKGQYRLIDLEHLRFGPVSLELAFLICWDSFCGDSPILDQEQIQTELTSLKRIGFLTQGDNQLIIGVFIPMLAYLAQSACITGRFREPESILFSLSKQAARWRDYYFV